LAGKIEGGSNTRHCKTTSAGCVGCPGFPKSRLRKGRRGRGRRAVTDKGEKKGMLAVEGRLQP